MNQVAQAEGLNPNWKGLVKIGGAAALTAGILFRRNIAAEIGLFSQQAPPVTISNWFDLLQSNRLLGLAYLNVFDLVNYALLALMFLALFAALKRANRSAMVIATTLGLLGIAVYLASNTAFSMLALSDQYAAATTDTERVTSLAAGEAMLAMNRFSGPGAHPGTGGLVSLFLIAAAGMLTSVVMLRSKLFSRATAYVGLLAGALDLAYCIAFVFVPTADSEQLAVLFIPAAGLFLMIWHVLIGLKLYRLGRLDKTLPKAS